MSEGISRRNMVVAGAASGAVFAMAGCTKANEPIGGQASATMQLDAASTNVDGKFLIDILGEGCTTPLNSRNPHDAAPSNWDPFEPKNIHIVHIESPAAWKFRVNQAHFSVADLSTNDRATRLARCVEIMEERLQKVSADPGSRFIDLAKFLPLKNEENEWADYTHADRFKYGSQHEVYIYIEGGRLTFNERLLISFSGKRKNGNSAEANHAFFNATLLDKENTDPSKDIGKTLASKGRIIRFDNYFTKPNGKKIQKNTTDKIDYSLNFHYGQPTIGGNSVPMIFDPDTGNGAGNEP